MATLEGLDDSSSSSSEEEVGGMVKTQSYMKEMLAVEAELKMARSSSVQQSPKLESASSVMLKISDSGMLKTSGPGVIDAIATSSGRLQRPRSPHLNAISTQQLIESFPAKGEVLEIVSETLPVKDSTAAAIGANISGAKMWGLQIQQSNNSSNSNASFHCPNSSGNPSAGGNLQAFLNQGQSFRNHGTFEAEMGNLIVNLSHTVSAPGPAYGATNSSSIGKGTRSNLATSGGTIGTTSLSVAHRATSGATTGATSDGFHSGVFTVPRGGSLRSLASAPSGLSTEAASNGQNATGSVSNGQYNTSGISGTTTGERGTQQSPFLGDLSPMSAHTGTQKPGLARAKNNNAYGAQNPEVAYGGAFGEISDPSVIPTAEPRFSLSQNSSISTGSRSAIPGRTSISVGTLDMLKRNIVSAVHSGNEVPAETSKTRAVKKIPKNLLAMGNIEDTLTTILLGEGNDLDSTASKRRAKKSVSKSGEGYLSDLSDHKKQDVHRDPSSSSRDVKKSPRTSKYVIKTLIAFKAAAADGTTGTTDGKTNGNSGTDEKTDVQTGRDTITSKISGTVLTGAADPTPEHPLGLGVGSKTSLGSTGLQSKTDHDERTECGIISRSATGLHCESALGSQHGEHFPRIFAFLNPKSGRDPSETALLFENLRTLLSTPFVEEVEEEDDEDEKAESGDAQNASEKPRRNKNKRRNGNVRTLGKVCDLSTTHPREFLFAHGLNKRDVLVTFGGDGTVNWLLSCVAQIILEQKHFIRFILQFLRQNVLLQQAAMGHNLGGDACRIGAVSNATMNVAGSVYSGFKPGFNNGQYLTPGLPMGAGSPTTLSALTSSLSPDPLHLNPMLAQQVGSSSGTSHNSTSTPHTAGSAFRTAGSTLQTVGSINTAASGPSHSSSGVGEAQVAIAPPCLQSASEFAYDIIMRDSLKSYRTSVRQSENSAATVRSAATDGSAVTGTSATASSVSSMLSLGTGPSAPPISGAMVSPQVSEVGVQVCGSRGLVASSQGETEVSPQVAPLEMMSLQRGSQQDDTTGDATGRRVAMNDEVVMHEISPPAHETSYPISSPDHETHVDVEDDTALHVAKMFMSKDFGAPRVVPAPLGSGNDLARTAGWAYKSKNRFGGIKNSDLGGLLHSALRSERQVIDLWELLIIPRVRQPEDSKMSKMYKINGKSNRDEARTYIKNALKDIGAMSATEIEYFFMWPASNPGVSNISRKSIRRAKGEKKIKARQEKQQAKEEAKRGKKPNKDPDTSNPNSSVAGGTASDPNSGMAVGEPIVAQKPSPFVSKNPPVYRAYVGSYLQLGVVGAWWVGAEKCRKQIHCCYNPELFLAAQFIPTCCITNVGDRIHSDRVVGQYDNNAADGKDAFVSLSPPEIPADPRQIRSLEGCAGIYLRSVSDAHHKSQLYKQLQKTSAGNNVAARNSAADASGGNTKEEETEASDGGEDNATQATEMTAETPLVGARADGGARGSVGARGDSIGQSQPRSQNEQSRSQSGQPRAQSEAQNGKLAQYGSLVGAEEEGIQFLTQSGPEVNNSRNTAGTGANTRATGFDVNSISTIIAPQQQKPQMAPQQQEPLQQQQPEFQSGFQQQQRQFGPPRPPPSSAWTGIPRKDLQSCMNFVVLNSSSFMGGRRRYDGGGVVNDNRVELFTHGGAAHFAWLGSCAPKTIKHPYAQADEIVCVLDETEYFDVDGEAMCLIGGGIVVLRRNKQYECCLGVNMKELHEEDRRAWAMARTALPPDLQESESEIDEIDV